MKLISSYILILFMGLAIGCSKDKEAPCSNASNATAANCQTVSPDISNRPLSLDIVFKDSYYYDQNTASWQTIKKENLTGGIFGQTAMIYSNFLNISKDAALSKFSIAGDQFTRQSSYSKTDYNHIPYIEIQYEEGAEYLFNYQKRDLNNNVVFETTGNLIVSNGRAYLPLINEMFSNQFYASTSNVGSRFIHTIRFSAQGQNKVGTISPTIEFETNLQIPNVDFTVEYADDIKNFTLKDRWNFYFKNLTDYSYNDQFKFFTLKQITDVPEQIPVDLRIVFQEPPKLRIQQEVFGEYPWDGDTIRNNGKAIDANVQRGLSFYTQKNEFNSDTDFKFKVRVNNSFRTLDSGRQVDILSLPVGSRWDMEFFFDMNQNALYTNTDGRPLFNPLRPECDQIKNSLFNPLTEQINKKTAITNGGYISICHPQTNGKLIIPSDQISISPYTQEDTYYNHFNYMPMNLNTQNREVGYLHGIRRVTFIAEGCVRILVRQSGNTQWEIKSKGNVVCDQSGTGSTEGGWTYFYAEKTATIFDNIADYEIIPGLKSLLQFFGNKAVKQTTDFKFNGDVNNGKHIY